MSQPSDHLVSELSDRYLIERELGGRGMSRVFLATETGLGRSVVSKSSRRRGTILIAFQLLRSI